MRKPGNGDAKRIIERALKIRVNKFGSDHPLVARCIFSDPLGFNSDQVYKILQSSQIRLEIQSWQFSSALKLSEFERK